MERKPTYEQAKLHLKIYDLRRETRLRQARDWVSKNFHPQTIEEAMRMAPPGTEYGAFLAMVCSYWENACALLNYGLLHEDLFFETSGEFFGVWEQIKGIMPGARKMFVNPHYLEQLEKAAQSYESWQERRAPGHIAAMREYRKKMQPELKKTA
jgi:hypothetical protein